MLKSLFRIGISSELNSYLRIKVILSNQIAFIITLVMLCYLICSRLYFPQISFIYISGILTMVLGIFLNYLKIFKVSRFIIAITPTWFSLSTYISISSMPNTGFTEIFMIGICMLVAPFVLFDAREAMLRNLSFLICALPLLFYRQLDMLIQFDVDASIIETNPFAFLNRALSLLSMFGYVAVLQATTKKTEDKNRDLIQSMESQTKDIEEKTKVLEKTLEQVQKAKDDEEKRNWVANGLTQINILARAENDNKRIYDLLISAIIHYLKANQGAIYVVDSNNGNEKYISLQSCYAFEKKKFIEKRIEIGQGLIGQCYLEKQKIIINTVPDNYIKITSGLGEANPRSLAIVPLIMNDEVQGMIEIATFNNLQSHELDYIEKTAENIASLLHNIKTNETTRTLLAESLGQAEIMRAQEEEMRQNMEELHATQEELQRKEQGYIERINALENEIMEKMDYKETFSSKE